jgi:hypothetical protein
MSGAAGLETAGALSQSKSTGESELIMESGSSSESRFPSSDMIYENPTIHNLQ